MGSYEIRGKVFFISGGAQGLGKAVVEGVLAEGAKVFVIDIDASAGKATLEEFAAKFGSENIAFKVTDVTDQKQFEDAYIDATNKFGYVDVLFNNAGLLDEINVKNVVDVNVTAVMYGTEIARARMRKDLGGRGGRIINMSSIAGLFHYPWCPAYTATKHAVRAYTTALSQESRNQDWALEFASLHPDGCNVGIFTKLEGTGRHDVDMLIDQYTKLGLIVEAEEVAKAFIHLVTQDEMNGKLLKVERNKLTFVQAEFGDGKLPYQPTEKPHPSKYLTSTFELI